MKVQMRTILRPDFVAKDNHGNQIIPKLSDYLTVPKLATFGTFQVVDLLPMETLVSLSHLRDQLAGVTRRKGTNGKARNPRGSAVNGAIR